MSFLIPAAALISDKFDIEPIALYNSSTRYLNSVMQNEINPQLKIFAFNIDYHMEMLSSSPETNAFHMKKIASAQEKIHRLYQKAEEIKSSFAKAKQSEIDYAVFEELVNIPPFNEPIELGQTYIANFPAIAELSSQSEPEKFL